MSRFYRFIALLGFLITGTLVCADDWPQWRGKNRDGLIENFAAPTVWPENLEKLWQLEVGEGYSSPVLENERVFIHTRQGEEEWVRCLELSSGKLVWEKPYPATGNVHPAGASHGIGPKSTPAIAGGRLYTLGIGSILSCFDLRTGELYWRKEFSPHFEKPAPSCGTAMSPLIVDGLCIVHVGVDAKGEMIAFDAKTGSQRWTYDGDGPGYGSPILATLNGKRQIVSPVSKFIVGLSVEDGTLIWRHPFPTRSSQNIVTPVVDGERLITGGIGQTTVALRLLGDVPAPKIETVWKNPNASLHMSSPVLADDRLFGLANRKKGQLFCLNAESGETIWTSEGNFAKNATLLLGDGHLIVLSSDGNLVFVKSDSEAYEPVASYKVSEARTWAHPLVSGSRIIIKDESVLTCWTLAQKEPGTPP